MYFRIMRGSCAQYHEKDVVFKTKKRPSKDATQEVASLLGRFLHFCKPRFHRASGNLI